MLERWVRWKGEGERGASMDEVRWAGILTLLGYVGFVVAE